MVSVGIDPLRAAAENAAFVIGVMEFDAAWADTAAYEQKKFCSNQHTESGGQEIDPESMPTGGCVDLVWQVAGQKISPLLKITMVKPVLVAN